MIVLSLTFHPLPSSYLPWSLTSEVFEFCTGVGGVILLLESGGVITVEPSYLISSLVSGQQCARFLEKRKDCGSTNSQSEQQGETSHNSVTTDEGEQAHQSHQAQHARAHKKQAHGQTGCHAPPRGLPKKHLRNSPDLPLTKNVKGFHRNKTLTSSFTSLRFVLFFLLFSFILFTLFFFCSLSFCFPFLRYFTHLPWASCSRSLLRAWLQMLSQHLLLHLALPSILHYFFLCQVPQAFLCH